MNVNLTSPKYSGSAGTLRVIFKVYGDSPSINHPLTCCAAYTSYPNCSISPSQGGSYSRPINCFAVPVHAMSYPILPQHPYQTSLSPNVTQNSCILQGIPVTCYMQAPYTNGAVSVSKCSTPYSESHYYRGSSEYSKVMDVPTWVATPSTVFSPVQPN